MIRVSDYICRLPSVPDTNMPAWEMVLNIRQIINNHISTLGSGWVINNDIAVHATAVIETTAVIKGPAVIGPGCFIGHHSLLRDGVLLTENVRIGASCEIKSTIICHGSTVAHFNFIGDSLIGSDVNVEAGAVFANHFNERTNKIIAVTDGRETILTGTEKFGALVGDHCKIGANAVLSPGTILKPGFVVKRLELIQQCDET